MSAAVVDMSGRTFGQLTVRGRDGVDKNGYATWFCDCTCGRSKSVSGYLMRRASGGAKSCGCLRKEVCARNARARRGT